MRAPALCAIFLLAASVTAIPLEKKSNPEPPAVASVDDAEAKPEAPGPAPVKEEKPGPALVKEEVPAPDAAQEEVPDAQAKPPAVASVDDAGAEPEAPAPEKEEKPGPDAAQQEVAAPETEPHAQEEVPAAASALSEEERNDIFEKEKRKEIARVKEAARVAAQVEVSKTRVPGKSAAAPAMVGISTTSPTILYPQIDGVDLSTATTQPCDYTPPRGGYLAQGNNVVVETAQSVAAAATRCTGLATCAGFTYSGSLPGTVWYKTSASTFHANGDWTTYSRSQSKTCFRYDSRSFYINEPTTAPIIKLKFCNDYDISVNMYWVGPPQGPSNPYWSKFFTDPTYFGLEYFVKQLSPDECVKVSSYAEYPFRFRAAADLPSTYERPIYTNDELFYFVTKSWHADQARVGSHVPGGWDASEDGRHEVKFTEQNQDSNYAYGNLDLITCPYTAGLVKWGLIQPDRQGRVDLDDLAKALRITRAFKGAHRDAMGGDSGTDSGTWRGKINDCKDGTSWPVVWGVDEQGNWVADGPGTKLSASRPCSNLYEGGKFFSNVYDMDLSVFEHMGGDTKTRDPYFDPAQMETLLSALYGTHSQGYPKIYKTEDQIITDMTKYDADHNGDMFFGLDNGHAGKKTISVVSLASLGSNGIRGTHDGDINHCTPKGRKGFSSTSLFTELYENNDLTWGLPIWKCANTEGGACTSGSFDADLTRKQVMDFAGIGDSSYACCDRPENSEAPPLSSVSDTRVGYLAMGGNVVDPEIAQTVEAALSRCEFLDGTGTQPDGDHGSTACTGITYSGGSFPTTVWYKNRDSSGPWHHTSWTTVFTCKVARCYPPGGTSKNC